VPERKRRVRELANLPPQSTRFNISGQVSASKAVAEIEGFVVNRYEDLSKVFADRTLEEKEFFITYGYFPNAVEPKQPSPPGSEGPGKDGAQQNQNGTNSSAGAAGSSLALRVGD